MLAGNEIGNQLFLEGDNVNAVTVYKGLLGLDEATSWKLPIYYQIGLCFERLLQPDKALEAYGEIIRLGGKVTVKLEPSLQMVLDMARFRHDILSWKKTVDKPDDKIEEYEDAGILRPYSGDSALLTGVADALQDRIHPAMDYMGRVDMVNFWKFSKDGSGMKVLRPGSDVVGFTSLD